MTTNQTIDGVPREDFTGISQAARAMAATTGTPGWGSAVKCFTMHCTPFVVIRMADEIERLRALLDAELAPCAKSQVEPAVQPQPDPVLCKFYDVTDYPDLVRELVGHVALLQDSAKRNVKPWEDTFPPTLLPAYIERVDAENAAAKAQGEPVAYLCKAKGSKWLKYGSVVSDPWLPGEVELTPLYAEQPAPVAVVLAEAREWLGDGKHSDGLHREHWTPEYAALIDRIDATLRT